MLKILIIFLCFLPAIGTCSIDKVIDLYKKSSFSCPEKIWPGIGANPNKDLTLIFSNKTKTAYFLNNRQATKVAYHTEMNEIDYFDFRPYKDKETVWLNVDLPGGQESLTSLQIFNYVFHESFHLFHQDEMFQKYSLEGREGTYPLEAEPRIVRQHLKRALIDYLKGNGRGLSQAKFWHNLHLKYNEKLEGDVIEGSAQYVSYKAQALANLGCKASDQDLKNYIIRKIEDEESAVTDKELEHYDIGALAFLSLEKNLNKTIKDLSGIQLLDYLFKGVEEAPAPTNSSLVGKIKKSIEGENQAFELLYSSLKELDQPHLKIQSFIALPYSSFLSAQSSEGAFKLKTGAVIDQNYEASIYFGKIKGNSFSQSAEIDSLCGNEDDYTFKVESSMQNQKEIEFRGPGFNFVIPTEKLQKKILNSAEIYCLKI